MSTAPGVASRPSPGTIVLPVPTTTSTPSSVSGFPARPIALIRPSRTPIDTVRMPVTGSSRVTLVTTTSQVCDAVAARRCIPSRAVLPNPVRNSSPACCASASTRITSPVSASSIRSPAVGPLTAVLVMARPVSAYPQALAFSRARSRAPGASSGPSTRPANPITTRRPPMRTSPTWRVPPGSNRTAAPAATARCMPYAAARSKRSRGLASKKWKWLVTEIGTAAVLVTSTTTDPAIPAGSGTSATPARNGSRTTASRVPSSKVASTRTSGTARTTPGSRSGSASTERPASIASARRPPSLAASHTASATSAVASTTFSRRPRRRLARASSAVRKTSSRSRSASDRSIMAQSSPVSPSG